MSRPLLSVLVALWVLAGCSSVDDTESAPEPSSPSPTSAAVPTAEPVPTPEPDGCHALSYAQAVAPTSDTTTSPCRRAHTAETFSIGELRTIRDGHLLAVDSAAVQRQVAETCPRRLAGFVGGSEEDLRLSMLRSVWFTPTVEQSDAGANWFRCDAVVVAGEERLAEVRGRLEGVLATEAGRERLGICGTAEPGAADFTRTLCRERHSWRAIGTVGLLDGRRRGAAYPGERVVRRAGQDVCDDQGRAVADDALDYQWGYEWPSAEQWASGQTYGRCWAPDPSP